MGVGFDRAAATAAAGFARTDVVDPAVRRHALTAARRRRIIWPIGAQPCASGWRKGERVMGWTPLSVGWNRIRENRLRQDEADVSAERDAARHQSDGDEAEAIATRHAEERRKRREERVADEEAER